jgi:hypothetical protein
MGSLRDLAGEEKREGQAREAAAYARLAELSQPETSVLLEMAGCFHPPYALWKVGRSWQLLDVSFDSIRYGFVKWPRARNRTISALKRKGLIERTENVFTEEYRLSEQGQSLMNHLFRLAKKEYDAINKKPVSHPIITAGTGEEVSTCTEPEY